MLIFLLLLFLFFRKKELFPLSAAKIRCFLYISFIKNEPEFVKNEPKVINLKKKIVYLHRKVLFLDLFKVNNLLNFQNR